MNTNEYLTLEDYTNISEQQAKTRRSGEKKTNKTIQLFVFVLSVLYQIRKSISGICLCTNSMEKWMKETLFFREATSENFSFIYMNKIAKEEEQQQQNSNKKKKKLSLLL